MSKTIKLYPTYKRIGQDFSNVEKMTVPNQTLTLKEILRRYIKKEPLPSMKEGTFHESEYDLEKLSQADLTEQHEVIEELKQKVKRKKKVVDDYQEEQKKKEEERAKGSQAPEPPKA